MTLLEYRLAADAAITEEMDGTGDTAWLVYEEEYEEAWLSDRPVVEFARTVANRLRAEGW